jgi:tRNA(Ile)-lysidine synthase
MIKGARGVLVAVSGGPDSVALLDMLFRLATGSPHTAKVKNLSETSTAASGPAEFDILVPPLYVAHLDHLLRGQESKEDAAFVKSLAERLGLEVTINSIDVLEAASNKRLGIEEAAREVRYEFLQRVALEAGCDRIAVGHTMNDQAETFLMRLIRGTGLRGLTAMRPIGPVPSNELLPHPKEQTQSEPSSAEAGESWVATQESPVPRLIRPLLCIKREEVLEYCRKRGLEYRTDPTNSSSDYTRTVVRQKILPALTDINPQIVESIFRATENIAGDEDVLNGLAASVLASARATDTNSTAVQGNSSYSAAVILEQPTGMRRRIIAEAIRTMRLNRGNVSPVEGEITSAHIIAVERLLNQGSSGKRVILPGGLEVWRDYDFLVFQRRDPRVEIPFELELSSNHSTTEAGGFALDLQRGLSITAIDSIIAMNRRDKQRGDPDWMNAALDDQKLPEKLLIRPRLRGERARVIGRRRTIKLKNLMIDHRIPSSRRATWPIVTTPDGRYIWSPGLPPSLEFAARAESQGLAILRASAI